MSKILKSFLILIVLYHLLVTIIQYGIFGGSYPEIPALLRDGLRALIIIVTMISNYQEIIPYLKKWKRPWISLLVLLIFSVIMSYAKGKGISDILVGIKYGFLYLPIFLSAAFLGHSAQHSSSEKLKSTLSFIKYLLISTVIIGFLRQITKFIRPELFYHMGYGPLSDFKFGAKPPIYYLTGYQGTWRRQGLFAGPNNYGYFLVALLPAIIILCQGKRQSFKTRISKKQIQNSIYIVIWLLAIVCTLSRTAAIGGIVGLALINMQWIRQHKKHTSMIAMIALLGLIGLSFLKGASTLGHIQAKFGSIQYVISTPSGYGLGTSGPAVHHNGNILPENYFLQLMLDIGTLGFLLRAFTIRQIQRITRTIKKYFSSKEEISLLVYRLRMGLSIGRIALLVMGIFLHVFEDSMVNYIFFILRGRTSGYLISKR